MKLSASKQASPRERYKEETKNYLLNFKNRSNELKLNQDHIDKLLQEEMERQAKKRQDVWDKEQQARINLMTDVYANRAEAVGYKKNLQDEELRRKEREKQQVTEELDVLKRQDKKSELEEYLVAPTDEENEATPKHHLVADQREE